MAAQYFFRFLVPLALALFLAAPPALAHDDPVENEIHDLLDAFLAGASANDIEMHDRFWAEDLVYTSSSGERYGKAAIMENLSNAPQDTEDQPVYSSKDVKIRVYDDMAVVTFRLVAAELADDASAEFFNTGVFQKRDGQWKAFTWQATRIPENGE